jgi:hypothetical protein
MKVEFYVVENLADVWTLAGEQGEGLAVCHTVDVEPKVDFDPENYKADFPVVHLSPDKKVFVVNCDHAWLSQVLDLSNPEKYVSFDIGGPKRCVVSMDLANDFVGCEVPSAPAPESVVEPEPSDFEVESWVPQDESTEEDDE